MKKVMKKLVGLGLSAVMALGCMAGCGTETTQNGGTEAAQTTKDNSKEVLIPGDKLINPETGKPIRVRSFTFSEDNSQVLIYTNTRRVWRMDTRGDYWVLNIQSGKLQQLGKARPEATLMFAKFSPDGTKVAYVSENNIYVRYNKQQYKYQPI